MHAAEAPQRILGAEPDDQVTDFLGYRRAPRGARLSPLLLYQALVPGEQSAWGDDSVAAESLGQDPRECGEQRPIRPVGLRRGDLTA
jgi:hypothetical protein